MKDYLFFIGIMVFVVILSIILCYSVKTESDLHKCYVDRMGNSYEFIQETDYMFKGYKFGGYKYETTKIDKNTPKIDRYFLKDYIQYAIKEGFLSRIDCDYLYRTGQFKDFK